MPSSLTEVLSSTWVSSTSPPVSVCGTVTPALARGFSRRYGLNAYGSGSRPPLTLPSQRTGRTDLPVRPAYRVGGLAAQHLAPRVPPSLCAACATRGRVRNGNLDPLSIAYGASPRLRPASPAADQHGCGTLGHSVGGIRTPLALLMPTFALPAAPRWFPPPLLSKTGTLPYHGSSPSAASVTGLSPGGLSAPRHTRPVSYYALFQGWLLLSQPPGCFCTATTLPT